MNTRNPAFRFPYFGGALIAATLTGFTFAGTGTYTYTDLGVPDADAYSIVGVRMNNHGHVAGWSQYFGVGEPSLRGWFWTPEDGFTILPPPPDFFSGRSRAMDINDNGVVAGDGGFDIGLAWRYEDDIYTVTGSAERMPIAYLGGINEAGDIAGTAKDAQIITPDYGWLNLNGTDGEDVVTITPSGGRATDLNNNGQVCGYSQGPLTGFAAYRWDASGGQQFLGTLGLAYSFANRMNDAGDVVGTATSASGNTDKAWIYTDEGGMDELPAPFANASSAISINNDRHVVGMTAVSGPDINWLWTGGDSTINIASLFDTVGENVNVISVRDINDEGQILIQVFDNDVADFRMAVLTPPATAMPGDLDGDEVVAFSDLLVLLAAWGSCGNGDCAADLDTSGDVGFADLLILLSNWS